MYKQIFFKNDAENNPQKEMIEFVNMEHRQIVDVHIKESGINLIYFESPAPTKTYNELVGIEILDFIKNNNLEIIVKQRAEKYFGSCEQFYAFIKDADIIEGSASIGVVGNGRTPDNAIRDYAEKISNRKIRINIIDYIQVPTLKHTIQFTGKISE